MTIGVTLVIASRDGKSATLASRAQAIESQLRCVECQSLSIADSDSPTARASRDEIVQRLRAGQSERQILQAFVDRYGEFVLLKPRSHGIGLVVWGLPVVAITIAVAGLLLALRRWKRQPRLLGTRADEALVKAARSERPPAVVHSPSRASSAEPESKGVGSATQPDDDPAARAAADSASQAEAPGAGEHGE